MLNKDNLKLPPQFNPSLLDEDKRKDYFFIKKRIEELKKTRDNHYGVDLNQLWTEADKAYIPHRLKTKGKVVVAEDETLGWRGNMVVLGSNDWQSDIAQPNPYIKIQTALAILIDQNPQAVFTATSKKYEATSELIKQLYQRSWEFAKSKSQLKLFVYNLAKYGWAIGRTYRKKIKRKVKIPIELNPNDPNKIKYQEKEITEYDDIMRENLDPRNTWIDDKALPNNAYSIRDWCYRKLYSLEEAEEEFGEYDFWKYVKQGGIISEVVDGGKVASKEYQDKKLVEIYFYENRLKDIYAVIANDVPIILDPLPIADEQGIKKMTLWQTYWNIRHSESPYGIGMYEAMRYDNAMLDRIRNMTLDQLTLSIYKMFFYQGTQALSETGDIVISPGVGKQVLDPKNIQWLEIKGPGAEAWEGLKILKKDVDDASAITEPLTGEITGKTAFELAQAKEAGLKRLKDPLDNIEEALNYEAYITINLIQQLYSIPKTYEITDKRLIEDYLNEIKGDPDLYDRKDGKFIANIYREFPLNLEKDEKDNLIATDKTQFFRIKPKFLAWEGIINVKSQSLLTPSKQIDKALDLEMYNMLIPLFAQSPEIYLKVAKNIVKLYDKDARDILPDQWLNPQAGQQKQDQPIVIPADQAAQNGTSQPGAPGQQPPTAPPGQGADKLVSSTKIPDKPVSMTGKVTSSMIKPFRKM